MTSLRVRLVAWYVSLAAIVVLFIALLASVAVFEVLSHETRESLNAAARKVPALIAEYDRQHAAGQGIETYLQQQLTSFGVFVHVHGTARPGAYPAGPGGPGRPPWLGGGPRALLGSPSQEPPFFARFYALTMNPVTVHDRQREVTLFVDPEPLRPTIARLWLVVGIFAVLVLSVAWRIAMVVARQTLEPLVRTTVALNRFGDGDFTPEAVSTSDRSEVGELASAYNRAIAQITRALDERSRAEAEMRQFVADAGHQLRTPLTVIMGYLSAMEPKAASPLQAMAFRSMLEQSRRMRLLIDDLVTLARLEHESPPTDTFVELNELCSRVTSSFSEASQKRIHVTRASAPVLVNAGEEDLLGALVALVDNALKYAPLQPVTLCVVMEGDRCVLTVEDCGPGMSEADLRNAFDRFYRGSSSEGIDGTGLGLSIVRKGIASAGGTVVLRNREGGGLICTICLPLPHAQPALAV